MEHFWTWMRNGTAIVTTPVDVDMANEEELAAKLLAASEWSPVLVVDANTCGTFFSVAAMRVLHLAGRRMAATGGEVRLVLPVPDKYKCRSLLKTVRYDKYLQLFESLDEAVEAPQQNLALEPQAA